MSLLDRMVVCGDCVEEMASMPENSVDAIVCDPPYDLTSVSRNGSARVPGTGTFARVLLGTDRGGFMGKSWDGTGVAFRPETWVEVLRVLKPGGHLLAFGGTRTYHRLTCAIEDAGFEIRDSICFLRQRAEAELPNVLEAWLDWSNRVKHAGVRFVRNPIAVSPNMHSSDSALGYALLDTSLAKSPAAALIAELRSSEVHLTNAAYWRSALVTADAPTTESSALVTIAVSLPGSPDPKSFSASIVPSDVPTWLAASMEARIRAVEALRIWLGSGPSLRRAATDVLCVALTDALRHIICAQSETFQNYDTTLRTVSACATTVTTTVPMAALLISFTVDTLGSQGGDAQEASGGPLAWIYGSGFP